MPVCVSVCLFACVCVALKCAGPQHAAHGTKHGARSTQHAGSNWQKANHNKLRKPKPIRKPFGLWPAGGKSRVSDASVCECVCGISHVIEQGVKEGVREAGGGVILSCARA